MAGSKRQKVKKLLSPASSVSPPPAMESDDLVDDLLAQLDSRDETVQSEAATVLRDVQSSEIAAASTKQAKASGRNRFEARQAKKITALAENYGSDDTEAEARIQQEAIDEERTISGVCDEIGLTMHEINPDGHCLFAAVADQLHILGLLSSKDTNYTTTRHAASQYMFTHPDDFLPFLPSVTGEDGAGATNAGIMQPREFEQYCATIRDTGIWGGEPEILALSRAYNVPIHVIQTGNPPIVVHDPNPAHSAGVHDRRVARISYHRRMYGLGEHYNSLRPKGALRSLMTDTFA